MNDIVARLYSYMMTAMHVIFIAVMVWAAFIYLGDNLVAKYKYGFSADPANFWVLYLAVIIAYLLSVGTLITFVRINENLEAIREHLERAPLPSGGFEPRMD
jgi:TRAP-type C4-dicarboxylate transport system permease small subunit